MQKIPYMLVVGDKEQASATVSVRLRSGEDLRAQSVEQFKTMAKSVIATKKLGLTPEAKAG